MASQHHNPSPLLFTEPSLVSLPRELLLVILCNLSDVASLRALIVTCSSIYEAYWRSRSTVLEAVIENQVPTYLLSDAIAVLRSSRMKPWMKGHVRQFMMHLSNDFDHLSTHWTLPDTLAIGNLYTQIQFFVADFASCGFAKQGFGTINAPSYLGPFSSTERRRIERAFYRFELYCNLFRERKYGDDRFSPEEQRDIFFASYTPWENEQLACIHDYLFDRLSIPFNDVAEHDIYWGEWYIPYFDDWDSPENFHKEGYLSLGLSYLHKIVTAETYEQRYDLISPVLRSNDNFLYEGLQTQGEDDGQPLPEYGNDAGQIYVDALLPGSEDFGPVRAWQWAHADSSRERYYFRDDQRVLRQSGYVMWDMSRISDWIELRWDSYPQLRSQIDDGEDERLRKAMQKSWSERSKVLQRGGRGWWAPGDESKVQWRVQVPIVKKVEADRSWTKKDQWINDMVAWRNKLGAGR